VALDVVEGMLIKPTNLAGDVTILQKKICKIELNECLKADINVLIILFTILRGTLQRIMRLTTS